MKICVIKNCDRFVLAKNMCQGHYTRKTRGQDMSPPLGSLPRSQKLKQYTACSVKLCTRVSNSHGMCIRHYTRKRNGLDLESPIRSQAPSGCWNYK